MLTPYFADEQRYIFSAAPLAQLPEKFALAEFYVVLPEWIWTDKQNVA